MKWSKAIGMKFNFTVYAFLYCSLPTPGTPRLLFICSYKVIWSIIVTSLWPGTKLCSCEISFQLCLSLVYWCSINVLVMARIWDRSDSWSSFASFWWRIHELWKLILKAYTKNGQYHFLFRTIGWYAEIYSISVQILCR